MTFHSVSLRCIHLHHEKWFVNIFFLSFLFRLPWTWLFMRNSARVHVPVFSGIRVAHLLLLIFMYYFGCFVFIVVFFYFPSLVFVPECILLISDGIWVLLIALTEAEAILNDRPLTYISTDPIGGDPVSPSHFLYTPLPKWFFLSFFVRF